MITRSNLSSEFMANPYLEDVGTDLGTRVQGNTILSDASIYLGKLIDNDPQLN